MTTMKNGTLRIALTAGFLALGATAAGAQMAHGSSDADAREVRVINDYHAPVRVYVQDADSRLHHLGRVLPSTAKSLEIDADIAAKGSFRIKVFPVAQPWTRMSEDSGIRTRSITLEDGEMVRFWVEPDLTNSKISIGQS
jgi:hypothetical protein